MDLVSTEVRETVRLAVWLGVLSAFGPFALAVLQLQVYTLVVPSGSMATAYGIIAGLVIISVTIVALAYVRDEILNVLGNRLARRLALPAILAAAERAAEPATAATLAAHDVEEIRRGATGVLCCSALDAVLVPVLLVLLAAFHWAFAALGLVCAVLALVVGLLTERATRSALLESNTDMARLSALVADTARCAEIVEALGMLPAVARRWAAPFALGLDRLRFAQSRAVMAESASVVLNGVCSGGIMILGATMALAGQNIGAGMIVGLLLAGRLMAPFSRLGAAVEEAAAMRAAWRRLDLLLRDAAAATPREAHAFPCHAGLLAAERVTLLLPGKPQPLLREVNLRVGPGEVVAIVGPPGAGKSTLLRMLLGMQQPTAGGVFLDGHMTAHWDREDLARHVGYLPQEPVLTEGTVAEAIARLAQRPDPAAVLRAARLAGAERMICGLPAGFATPLGGALRLSAGQRQRICLARAVYGRPRLVLLDEPAAFLDAEGEAWVVRMLRRLSAAGIGVVLTTHRPGLLGAAQRVLVLEGGVLRAASVERALPARAA